MQHSKKSLLVLTNDIMRACNFFPKKFFLRKRKNFWNSFLRNLVRALQKCQKQRRQKSFKRSLIAQKNNAQLAKSIVLLRMFPLLKDFSLLLNRNRLLGGSLQKVKMVTIAMITVLIPCLANFKKENFKRFMHCFLAIEYWCISKK